MIGPAPTTTTTSTTTTSTTSTTSTTLLPGDTWSIRGGDASAQIGISIAVDAADSSAILGRIKGSIDLGLGALTSAGGDDVMLAKLDSSGAPVWNKIFGDASDSRRSRCPSVRRARS